jgi:prepilin-type processing-associated H-X9-DG protein
MALRRDSRAMSWPARAFLPSHGTFVRRIEMLRNTKHVRPGSLPIVARLLTIGVLAALGLLVAGLRGPDGGSSVLAQDQPAGHPGGGGAQDAISPYNLDFLPADTKMLLAIQPGSLVRRREVRSLLNSFQQEPSFKKMFVVPPEDVSQVLVFWDGSPGPATAPGRSTLIEPPSGLVLRTAKPQDWKPLRELLLGGRPAEQVQHAGQTYLRMTPEGWALYMPDGQTLVAAREELLQELIEDRKAPAPNRAWDEAWKKATKGQVMLALETRWIRRRIAQFQQGPPGPRMLKLESFSPLWEKARTYAMGILANDKGLTVDLVAGAGTDQDAKPVAETIQAMLTLGKNTLQGMRQDLRRPVASGEGMEWLLQAAGSLLEKARVETSEGFVHLGANSDVDLAEGIKILVPAVRTARASARRAQSVNNLKQIGLALHNYHSIKESFPAAVNYGGKSGKVPYSWRVAILPYLEQQELYNAYDFDEPWDGPNNRKLIERMPAVYAYPAAEGSPPNSGHTAYFVFTGLSTALSLGPPQGAAGGTRGGMSAMIGTKENAPPANAAAPQGAGGQLGKPQLPTGNKPVSDGPTIMQITDGTSNTILAVEARREIPWTKPEDIPFDPKAPLPELGGYWEDGFNALFADGSVRPLKKSIQPHILKALITRDAGEVISSDSY